MCCYKSCSSCDRYRTCVNSFFYLNMIFIISLLSVVIFDDICMRLTLTETVMPVPFLCRLIDWYKWQQEGLFPSEDLHFHLQSARCVVDSCIVYYWWTYVSWGMIECWMCCWFLCCLLLVDLCFVGIDWMLDVLLTITSSVVKLLLNYC